MKYPLAPILDDTVIINKTMNSGAVQVQAANGSQVDAKQTPVCLKDLKSRLPTKKNL